MAQMRPQKLHDVFEPGDKEPNALRNGDAFPELVQCVDDKRPALVLDAKQKTTGREHWRYCHSTTEERASLELSHYTLN